MRKFTLSGVLACLLLAMIAIKPAASQEKIANLPEKQPSAVAQSSQLPSLVLTPASASAVPNQTIPFQLTWQPNDRYPTTGQLTNQFIYQFNWGDGQIGNVIGIVTASHSYNSPGNYTVSVTARPNPKQKLSEELRQVSVLSTPAQITVRSTASKQSRVTLNADKTNLIVGGTVTFSVTVNPPMPGAQFQFDFGDGPEQTTGSNQITHTYNAASTYNPMVIVLTKGARESATGPAITVTGTQSAQVQSTQITQPVPPTDGANPAPQAISFLPPFSPYTYSSGLQILLSATGGASGNPVVFSIDGSSTGAGSISGNTLTVTSAGILIIDANQAGNADFSAAPQVQRTIVVTTPEPTWPSVVAAAAGVIAVGIILWLILRRKPPPSDQSSSQPSNPTTPQASQQSFRYVANEGSANYQIRFKQPSRPLGSITLTPGMDQAEHTIEFPGKAGISRPGGTS